MRSVTIISILTLMLIGVGTYAHTRIEFTDLQLVQCKTPEPIPEISAQAAYVFDIKTGEVFFEKNGNAQLPLASLTKIVTVATAGEILNPSRSVVINAPSFEPEGDSGFLLNELWRVEDLMDFVMMTSSNDGARALALAAKDGALQEFIDAMNMLAIRAGTHQTFFLNETGLDISSTTAGAYGSARDMALILTYAHRKSPDIFIGSTQSANVFTSLSGFIHESRHTSSVAGEEPGQIIVKTGFTDLAGGNLAILTEVLPGRPVAFVVLGATRETRDSDIETLTAAARSVLKRATLCNNYGS